MSKLRHYLSVDSWPEPGWPWPAGETRSFLCRVLTRRAGLAALALVSALAAWVGWFGFRELQADSFRLLYAGRWIAQHGLPYREEFTLAAGSRPFADQQWLAELINYEVWRASGYAGVIALSVTAFVGAFAALFGLLRARGASIALGLACVVLGLFGSLTSTFVRAQTFALPLFVALLWLCLADADSGDGSWRVVLAVPLLALWANLHGSVLLGVGIAVTYLGVRCVVMTRAGRRGAAVRYMAVAGLALLSPLASPYGAHVLVYYREMFSDSALKAADIEVHPPTYNAFAFFQFALPLALVGLSAVGALRRRHRPSLFAVLAAVVTAVAAGVEMRNNVWLGLAAAVLVADLTGAWLPSRPVRPTFVMLLAAAAAALGVLGFARFHASAAGSFQAQAPSAAIAATVSYAAAHPCDRILADDLTASGLLWADPRLSGRVDFDGELEAYPQRSLLQWVAFEAADTRGWLTAARGFQLLVASATNQPELAARLARLPGARVLSRDSSGVAVVTDEPHGCGPDR